MILVILPTAQADPFDVRLVGGNVAWEGTVEVRVNDVWGTICALFVTRVEDVLCRQLGYPRAFCE